MLYIKRKFYFICNFRSLLTDGHKAKYKTSVITGTVHPVWEEEFVFSDISFTELQNSTLQLSVWDFEKGSSHVLLGGTRIGLGKLEGLEHDSFGEEVTAWSKMLEHTNEQKEFTLPLRSTLGSVKQ